MGPLNKKLWSYTIAPGDNVPVTDPSYNKRNSKSYLRQATNQTEYSQAHTYRLVHPGNSRNLLLLLVFPIPVLQMVEGSLFGQ